MREYQMQPCVSWDAGERVGSGGVFGLGVLGSSSLPVSSYRIARQAQNCWIFLSPPPKRNYSKNF